MATYNQYLAEFIAVERVQPGTEEIVLEFHRQHSGRLCVVVEPDAYHTTIVIKPLAWFSTHEKVFMPRAEIWWRSPSKTWMVTFCNFTPKAQKGQPSDFDNGRSFPRLDLAFEYARGEMKSLELPMPTKDDYVRLRRVKFLVDVNPSQAELEEAADDAAMCDLDVDLHRTLPTPPDMGEDEIDYDEEIFNSAPDGRW